MNDTDKPKRQRTPKPDDTRVSANVRLSAATHARLMAECDARMIASSIIVEKAIIKFLDELKPVDEQLSIAE